MIGAGIAVLAPDRIRALADAAYQEPRQQELAAVCVVKTVCSCFGLPEIAGDFLLTKLCLLPESFVNDA
jgi:hypothetical protein